MKRKWKVVAVALCAALGLTVAYAAAAGSEGDPLITLGYLKNVFTGQVQTMVNEAVNASQEQTKNDVNAAIQEWDAKVGQAVQDALNATVQEPASFASASVAEGKSLAVQAGCEVIVRSGAPTCSVALIDQTDGTVLAAGKALTANHLYLAAEAGALSVPGSAVTGVVNAGPLNVRAGAGIGYSRLGSLAEGTVVTVVDDNVDGWYMITGGGLAGYVSADFITLNPVTSSGPASLLIRGNYTVQ